MKKIVQTHKRPAPPTRRDAIQLTKPTATSNSSLVNRIQSFVQTKRGCYLGFGGLGDAILLLASCWKEVNGCAVFFANNPTLIHKFFEIFKIPSFIHPNIMGQGIANQVYDYVINLPNFKSSAHLADGLYYGDWVNEHKYYPRIARTAPWISHFGKETYNKPVCIIAPTGSQKDVNRQRYITKEEYQRLVHKHLDMGEIVYATGSIKNLHEYGLVNRENFYWLSSESIYTHKGSSEFCDLRKMLRIINASSSVISVDTWLKTYTLLCGIPTTVIETRWNGVYKGYGVDVSDWIFLNKNLWPIIELKHIEDLLA